MRTTTSSAALLLLFGGCGSADGGFDLNGDHYPRSGLTQWALPAELREVSGLALSPDGRLFAHGDERAIIFELDYQAGRAVKQFYFGTPAATGDFEGLAFVDERLFLVTSGGELLEGREGAPGEHVAFQRHRTGLGAQCEIEGLDYDPEAHTLLFACKQARDSKRAGTLRVLAWSPDPGSEPAGDVVVPWAPGDGPAAVHPSAVTRSPKGLLLLAAARQNLLIAVHPESGATTVVRLPEDAHPQTEGIAVTADGTLLLADEGRGGRGRLSAYRPR